MIAVGKEDDDRLKHLDLASLTFPSDTITLGALRKAHPEQFDIGFELADAQPQFFLDPGRTTEEVGDMLFCERAIAADAYATVTGIAPPDLDIDSACGTLTIYYSRYGLTTGEHHAAELIRGIELQAQQLAKDRPR